MLDYDYDYIVVDRAAKQSLGEMELNDWLQDARDQHRCCDWIGLLIVNVILCNKRYNDDVKSLAIAKQTSKPRREVKTGGIFNLR